MNGLAVGVDVGGTKLAAGLVAADGSILRRSRETTPARRTEELVPLIVRMVRELSTAHGARGAPVGVAVAGIVDPSGVLRYAPNIDVTDLPLAHELSATLDAPVAVDNDANAAAWAEHRLGAAAGAGSMVMLTVGTGVGGGLVLEGHLVRGAHGLGGEFGHMVVCEGGRLCSCGNHGCLEAMASGTAIGARAWEAAAAGAVPPSSPLHDLASDELTGKAVTIAAHGGDPFARGIVEDAGFWLGVGIASVVNALDPAVVVLGGGAMQAGDLLLTPARAAMEKRLVGRDHRPATPVVRAQLADDAGLVGAALLALEVAARPRTGAGEDS